MKEDVNYNENDDHMRKYHCSECEEHLKAGKSAPYPHDNYGKR